MKFTPEEKLLILKALNNYEFSDKYIDFKTITIMDKIRTKLSEAK